MVILWYHLVHATWKHFRTYFIPHLHTSKIWWIFAPNLHLLTSLHIFNVFQLDEIISSTRFIQSHSLIPIPSVFFKYLKSCKSCKKLPLNPCFHFNSHLWLMCRIPPSWLRIIQTVSWCSIISCMINVIVCNLGHIRLKLQLLNWKLCNTATFKRSRESRIIPMILRAICAFVPHMLNEWRNIRSILWFPLLSILHIPSNWRAIFTSLTFYKICDSVIRNIGLDNCTCITKAFPTSFFPCNVEKWKRSTRWILNFKRIPWLLHLLVLNLTKKY